MIDPSTGKWVANESCPRCRHRHPPLWSCREAREARDLNRQRDAEAAAVATATSAPWVDLTPTMRLRWVRDDTACPTMRLQQWWGVVAMSGGDTFDNLGEWREIEVIEPEAPKKKAGEDTDL